MKSPRMTYAFPGEKTSKFHGVRRHQNKWRAEVTAYGVRYDLGAYYSEEVAARVHFRKVLQLSYDRELLDFPEHKPMSNQVYYANEECLKYKPTTIEEEHALFLRAKAGDLEARDTIIKNHLLFVANRARAITRGKVPDDEVISAANVALMEAVDSFDSSRGIRFTRYLIPFIRGAVSKLWRDRPGMSKEFTEADCSEAAPSPAEEMEHQETAALMIEALTKARGKLTEKEQELLRQVYIEGLSFAEIARRTKVSRAAPQAAHGRVIEKLRKFMKGLNE